MHAAAFAQQFGRNSAKLPWCGRVFLATPRNGSQSLQRGNGFLGTHQPCGPLPFAKFFASSVSRLIQRAVKTTYIVFGFDIAR
jgi:hypothetical protein